VYAESGGIPHGSTERRLTGVAMGATMERKLRNENGRVDESGGEKISV
jgi:hypothetical protein